MSSARIGRAGGLAVALVACALLALVVTIVLSSGGRVDRVKGKNGRTIELTKAEAHGREVFATHCYECHTLRAANAVSEVGSDLDVLRPSAAEVRRMIQAGREGQTASMPPGIVTGADAADVAAFVAKVAGR